MQNLPDFSHYNYRIIRELGRNREGGRISYLAECLKTQQKVVIKQFRFVDTNASWSSYKAYEREISILESLEHPRIPRYFASFETEDGFCMIQEYKEAPSLAIKSNFSSEQVKKIAVSLLEILIYLQHHNPPIIHRDIKPENILIDEALNAYLIDFGLAKIRDGEIAHSTIAAGTPGFIPPEELFNRPLTESSDLYSLGATLICLLTQTSSPNVSELIDENYCFNFEHSISKLNPRFITWLNTLVNPLPKNRYPNAEIALLELRSLDVNELIIADKKPFLFYSFAKLGMAFMGLTILLGTVIKMQNVLLISDTQNNPPVEHKTPVKQATPLQNLSKEQAWYKEIKPHCNTVEVITMMKKLPYPKTTQGVGFAAGCYALAGKIDQADKLIQTLSSQEQYKAAGIVFAIGHPVADAGDDKSAGPIMELVIKYQPNNFMAVYHAGMSEYVLGDYEASKRNLTKFLDLYKREDGWRNNAIEVLKRMDSHTN
ncbi:MAG: serine/threonine-protein kinase [Crocosphaera sp.]|nr:serine/threonine-protein kinase [Crocosphaera sp.]